MGNESNSVLDHPTSQIERALAITDTTVWEWEIETDTVKTFPSPHSLFGAEIKSLEDFTERVHPDDQSAVERAVERALEQGEPYEVEFRILRDDDVRWIKDYGVVQVDENGEPDTILGVATDITVHKQHDQELQRLNELLGDMEQLADIGAYEVDVETGNVTWTDGMYRIFEVADEFEPTLENAIEFFHPEDQDRFWEAYEQRVETGEGGGINEARLITGKGNERWVRAYADVIDKAETQILRGFVQDITEQKEQEAELKRQNNQLEAFARLVSHDLRNPLNIAEGRLELAREDCDSEHLTAASTALDRMNELIDDLLSLAREGKQVTDLEPVQLAELSENCWGTVDTLDASLSIEIDAEIMADRSRLQQLFENLYRNAVEHAGQNVAVTVGKLEDGFYVEDDGPGIPADKHDDVFEAGYTTSEHGTGFGLSIVKQITDAHGWNIRITDSETGGARFEITGVEFPPP